MPPNTDPRSRGKDHTRLFHLPPLLIGCLDPPLRPKSIDVSTEYVNIVRYIAWRYRDVRTLGDMDSANGGRMGSRSLVIGPSEIGATPGSIRVRYSGENLEG